MNIEVNELKIVFYTNLIEQNYEKLEFTSEILYQPNAKPTRVRINKYPFFTSQVKYPVDKLKLLSYLEVVDFFFNKSQFINGLNLEQVIKPGSENFNAKKQEIIEHNIKTMFQYLFPTRFPIVNDHHASYDLMQSKNTFFGEALKNIGNTGEFSYLKLNNKIYTFKKLVWLNDLINHPEYNELLQSVNTTYEKILEKQENLFSLMPSNIETIYNFVDGIINKYLDSIEAIFKAYTEGKLAKGRGFDSVANIIDAIQKDNINLHPEAVDFLMLIFKLYCNCYILLKKTGSYEDNIIDKINAHETYADAIRELLNTSISETVGYYGENKNETMNVLYDNIYNGGRIDAVPQNSIQFINAKGASSSTPISDTNKGVIDSKLKSIEEKKANKQNYTRYNAIDKILNAIRNNDASILTTETIKNADLTQIFNEFTYTLRKYTSPTRITTNVFLQDIINSADKVRLFNLIIKIYNYFISNNKDSPLTKEENALLNVGISGINGASPTGPHIDIHVMADFFSGELNSENQGKIYCPFTNEYLGSQLERLIKYKPASNLLWYFEPERSIFSIEKISSDNIVKAGSSKNMELKEIQRPVNVERNQKIEAEPINDAVLYGWLNDIIENKLKDIEEELTTLQNSGSSNWKIDTLLENIKKNENKLYSAINNTFTNRNNEMKKYDTKRALIELQSRYKGLIDQYDLFKTTFKDTATKEKYNENLNNIAKTKIFSYIVMSLIAVVDGAEKDKSKKGGRKLKQNKTKLRKKYIRQTMKRRRY